MNTTQHAARHTSTAAVSGGVDMTEGSPTYEIASWLVNERGVSVIKLDHPSDTSFTSPRDIGKRPPPNWGWKMFQVARPTSDNLRSWFGNGHPRNIGIVTGAISGLVGVDCDSPEALTWADAHLPATPMATQTARGEHRFYRHPGVPVRNQSHMSVIM